MERKIIKLTKTHRGGIASTTFAGRSEGEQIRKELNLDVKDSDSFVYNVTIPNDTTSFNPSFFLGLFYTSIKKLGGVDKFPDKYVFDLSNIGDNDLKDILKIGFRECKRKAHNEYLDRTRLDL